MSSSSCSLYHYRFLASCQQLGGPALPSIDSCQQEADEAPSCNSFIRETCTYTGKVVLDKDSITDGHACQQLLQEVGWIYGAEYFLFDSNLQRCVFYDSMEMACDAVSGPSHPQIE